MRRALGLVSSFAIAAAVLVGVAPAAAQAATASPLHGLRIGPRAEVGSANWSGYADDQSLTYTGVKASWVEPTVTCPKPDAAAAIWVGLDGYSSTTVEQDGTITVCSAGTPVHYVWWEMYPTNAVQLLHTISPGDSISASVAYAGSKYTLAVTDSTHPSDSFTTTQVCASCVRSSAEWIVERPAHGIKDKLFPLADFGSLAITGAEAAAGGSYEPISTWTNTAIKMEQKGTPLDTITPTTAATTSFTVRWDAAT